MAAVEPHVPPVLGTVKPGELYVDLQKRTLWLGVTTSVDAAGAVLISDILALKAEDADIRADSTAYTNAKTLPLAPKASPIFSGNPTAPTVAQTDNDTTLATTAFVHAAVAAHKVTTFSRGMIMLYSGAVADIGVGALTGWHLCNGASGTPDLRDRFVVGAGNKAPGTKNAGTSLSITAGTHTHTLNAHALTLAELPSHNHGGATGTESVNHTHAFSATTNSAGAHSHTVAIQQMGVNTAHEGQRMGPGGATSTNSAGAHSHTVSGTTGLDSNNHTHTIPAAGSGTPHNHTMVGGAGSHTHAVTPAALREATSYYALAYIMKL